MPIHVRPGSELDRRLTSIYKRKNTTLSFCSSYLVNSIRPVLRLQTEGAVLPVPTTTLSCDGAIQEVGSVELDSWLVSRNL